MPRLALMGVGGPSGPVYLLLDQFTTNAAAPLASPRTAEPGPGTLTLVQTDGQFSIVSSALNFPAQTTPAWGDQGFYSGILAVTTGRTLLATANVSSLGVTGGTPVAFKSDQNVDVTGTGGNRFFIGVFTASLSVAVSNTSSFIVGGALSTGVSYQLAIILRTSGAFFLIKGGVYTEWTLLWAGNASIGASLYPAFSNNDAAGTLDNFRVTDLPAPWTDDFGIASQRLSGARTPGDTFTHEANCLIEFVNTTLPTAGNFNIVRFRQQDASNFWYINIENSGLLSLVEVVAGAGTTRGSAAGVVANGDRIVVVADGTTIRVYEANTLRITYASATNFQTATSGLLGAATNGVISDIVSWPRTLSGLALSTLSAV